MSSTPEFFEVLEDMCIPSIKEFSSETSVDLSEPVNVLFCVDVNVQAKVLFSIRICLSQGSVTSKPLFESQFYDKTKDTHEMRSVILLMDYISSNVTDASNSNINLILPNMDRCSEHDLASEIKRTVEWYYCINSAKNIMAFKHELGGEILNWKSISVKMTEASHAPFQQADIVVRGHLQNLISPYSRMLDNPLADVFRDKTITPMEQALILRLISSEADFLERMPKKDSQYLCSFLWNTKQAATYRSKVELFQKYISREILAFTSHRTKFNNDGMDIFNFTEVLRHNQSAVRHWIVSESLTDENFRYLLSVFGNGGYIDDEHYLSALKALSLIYKMASKHWKKEINKFVLESSEIEEMYQWAMSSEQCLLALGMECLESSQLKIRSFGKGLVMARGMHEAVQLIETKSQARIVCFLFNISPDQLLDINEHLNDTTREAIGQLILEEF